VDFLHRIIQEGESAYGQFLERGLEAGLTAYRSAQEQMEKALRGWMKPWVELSEADSRKELQTLRERVLELEAKLAERPGK